MAALAEGRGDANEAVDLYFKIVAASSRDRAARLRLARLLDARGDAVGARDQYKAALALKEDAETLLALVDAARRCRDGATEARALERLSQLDPGGAEWRRIAEIRGGANDAEGAERALRQAVSRDPKDLQNQLALGRQLARMGRSQEALEHLRAAGEAGAADRAALERKINLVKQTRPDVNALQQSVGTLIDRTYRGRLKDAPRLTGKLVIKVSSDAAGHAAQVEVVEDTLRDEDVRACAYWNLKDAAYPPNKPGRFTFSFALRPVN
jgi:tetratricopeptide (TPR) repeat protein